MRKLTKQLFKLLNLHTPSGKEWGVVSYLLPILRDTLDWVKLDEFGNLIGQKAYGEEDYTVLLSAHMDTVAYHQPIPKWRKNKTEIYNANPKAGALGGDDKCGIAAHLAVIRELNRGKTSFKGTLKVCFSREEERGCVGAYEAVGLYTEFFEKVDAVIVVDRKGGTDIVESCGGWELFCSPEYSSFWVDMAKKVGFQAIPQAGSISDTMVFSELGVNGVNLSAGYYNAHSSDEYIKIQELERTVRWIVEAFNHVQSYGTFPSFEYKIESKQDYYQSFYYGSMWGKNPFSQLAHDPSECVACDYCNFIHPVEDIYVRLDGTHMCIECDTFEHGTDDCDFCGDEVLTKDIIRIEEFKVCAKCHAGMKGEDLACL